MFFCKKHDKTQQLSNNSTELHKQEDNVYQSKDLFPLTHEKTKEENIN